MYSNMKKSIKNLVSKSIESTKAVKGGNSLIGFGTFTACKRTRKQRK